MLIKVEPAFLTCCGIHTQYHHKDYDLPFNVKHIYSAGHSAFVLLADVSQVW